MSKVRIIAHRGASGFAPENTMSAFKMAIEFGVKEIELDVQQTYDNKIIVIHDPVLDNTTDSTGSIGKYKYRELSKIDAGSWFDSKYKNEQIPLLADTLSYFKNKVKVIIEVKYGSRYYSDIEKNILKVIANVGFDYNDLILSSSKVTVLDKLARLDKDVTLAKILTPREMWRSIFHSNSFMFKRGLISRMKELHCHWSYIDLGLMNWANKRNIKVVAWTVNQERKMQTLINRGVHGIITDFPDIGLNLYGK